MADKRITLRLGVNVLPATEGFLAALESTLPEGIHVSLLTGTDPNRQPISRMVLWADPADTNCPRCAEPVTGKSPPVHLNEGAEAGGRLETWSLEHGCGEWITQLWEEVTEGADLAETVRVLAEQRAALTQATYAVHAFKAVEHPDKRR